MPKSKKTRKSAAAKKRTRWRKAQRRNVHTGELKHFVWKDVQLENLNPLLQRQMLVGQDVMLARIGLKKGCVVPLHSHHNEQISYILQGVLRFWVDGKEIDVREGEVLAIPPRMPHKVEALEESVSLDIFNPPRTDWLNKSDQYLREEK